MVRTSLLSVLVASLVVFVPSVARAQAEPYRVFDTRPLITEGPYLIATSDRSTTVVWLTDTPSHSRVRYGTNGSLDRVAEPQVDGLVPVGTKHVVHLTGLEPGTTYSYQVISTRVVKLKAYWPDKGLDTESEVHTFTTLDPARPTASFSVVTDTHEDVGRINRLMKMIDWPTTDFLVHTGDAFHWLDTEDQLLRNWLTPTASALAHGTPLVFARGNHELRGPFARNLFEYIPTVEGRFYYARDAGPVHLIVLDTTEDKPDDTNVYARLNQTTAYRNEEFDWLQSHVETSGRVHASPFRVIVMHQPQWGWLAEGPDRWMKLASDAGVDLVIAGHRHRFSYSAPEPGRSYHLLVVGQDQLARVDATTTELTAVVTGVDGVEVHRLVIGRRR
ncbi:MAG TPA: FN3 domain-containing metallophosphoesterase family protein [Vicinamibacterales bacterium]|nr:FN3 domain-containing metallophosphoesterase family protein [Vicinamibacterales bacterium]